MTWFSEWRERRRERKVEKKRLADAAYWTDYERQVRGVLLSVRTVGRGFSPQYLIPCNDKSAEIWERLKKELDVQIKPRDA